MISGQNHSLRLLLLAAGLVYLHFDEKRSKALYGGHCVVFLALLSEAP